MKVEAGIADEVSNFNMMVTNGRRIFGTRYSSNPDKETRTLYYSTGKEFQCSDGVCKMVTSGPAVSAVLIASEKLNDNREDWIPVPQNHFIAVDRDLNIHLSPMTH
jgi:predicted glutamine amidotransferase